MFYVGLLSGNWAKIAIYSILGKTHCQLETEKVSLAFHCILMPFVISISCLYEYEPYMHYVGIPTRMMLCGYIQTKSLHRKSRKKYICSIPLEDSDSEGAVWLRFATVWMTLTWASRWFKGWTDQLVLRMLWIHSPNHWDRTACSCARKSLCNCFKLPHKELGCPVDDTFCDITGAFGVHDLLFVLCGNCDQGGT